VRSERGSGEGREGTRHWPTLKPESGDVAEALGLAAEEVGGARRAALVPVARRRRGLSFNFFSKREGWFKPVFEGAGWWAVFALRNCMDGLLTGGCVLRSYWADIPSPVQVLHYTESAKTKVLH
jgi:hypothetical protein